MNYLASIASKALGPQQPNLLFSIGSLISEPDSKSIWAIHSGIKKDDQQKVTVFIFDMKRNPSQIPLARNALKRSKTIRFPDCLKFVDGVETETQIIIGTEQVESLQSILFKELDLNLVCLGIFKLATTLKFLTDDCKMVHGFISTSSVFVTRSGEWKLGGFECLSALQEEQSMLKLYGHLLPSTRYIAPELEGSSANPSPAVDAWSLGCLIWNIFNGSLNNNGQLEIRGKIPSNLYRHSKSLCISNPGARLDFQKFLKMASASKGYFDDPFISCCMFLEQFALKDKVEKEEFLQNVEHTVGTFPIEFCKFKILPELLHSLEFGGAGSKALKPILTIGGRFQKEDFNELVTPSIIKLFNSNDRSIRLALCEKIESYVENLTPQACNDTIFPNLASGFLDTTAIIREQTLKAVIVLAPKLSTKTINNALLRHLAKLQVDPEPGIRTNTTICLAKLSKYFDDSVKTKVLLQAFLRSLKDPFPFARKAGLMGISASTSSFTADDFAKRILPHISPLLMDPDRSIRDQAFSTMDTGLKLIKQTSNSMPDQLLPSSDTSPGKSEVANDGWTSWAASAVTSAASAAASRVMSSQSNTPRESASSQGSATTKSQPQAKVDSTKNNDNSFLLQKGKAFPPPSAKLQIPIESDRKVKESVPAADGWGWEEPDIAISPVESKSPKKQPQVHETSGWENDEWDKEQPHSPQDAKKGWDEDW